MSFPPLTARQVHARTHLDLATGRGLEIGPLTTPLVGRHEADVRYLDIHSAAGLREHYRADPAVPPEDVVEIDYVLITDDRVLPIQEAAAAGAPFDWVLASHVIEHVPDVIGWLSDLAAVLRDGARLSLVVPDRRYCFDARRPPTTVGQMLLAHASGDTRPSSRAIFDHFASVCGASPAELWAGAVPGPETRLHTVGQALELVDRSERGEYVDSHVWLFTPTSFVEQLDELSQAGLLDFTVVDVTATPEGELEFYPTLARQPRARDEAARRQAFVASAEPLLVRLADREALDRAAAERRARPGEEFPVSRREQQLLLAKRRLLGAARHALRR